MHLRSRSSCTVRPPITQCCRFHPAAAVRHSSRASSLILLNAGTFVAAQRRFDTTGAFHTFEPGPIARFLRRFLEFALPAELRKRIARRMERRLQEVKKIEEENDWLQRHGSPLLVLNLPEHAELPEVKEKYKELLLDTHPDTSLGVGAREEYELVRRAWELVSNPNSAWYLNGHGEHLLADVRKRRPTVEPVTVFAVLSFLAGCAISAVLCTVVVHYALLWLLYITDPKFYWQMTAKEAGGGRGGQRLPTTDRSTANEVPYTIGQVPCEHRRRG